jgi:streptomycin 3"-adenylyltransferase
VEEDPRRTAAELARLVERRFGRRLLGLYLFGSLAAGGFVPGRSDIDLFAVLADDVNDEDLLALEAMHDKFVVEHPEWQDRVEVLYTSHSVLATFAAAPTGTVARISPGEPLHHRDLEGNVGWLLDWHAVLTSREALFGPAPQSLGPAVSPQLFRDAVLSQLREMSVIARRNEVAYVPAQQGYIVATVSRALYSLETGQSTSKANAIEWLAERRPDLADYLRSNYAAYRADIRGPHERLIAFVDDAEKPTSEGAASARGV